MFEERQSKRVRRDELGTSAPPSPNHEADRAGIDLFRTRELDYVIADDISTRADGEDVGVEEALEFNLFARPAHDRNGESNTVRLRSMSPDGADGGILARTSPDRQALVFVPPASRLEEYQLAAVSGKDVLKQSRLSCPGLRYSWRVCVLPPAQQRGTEQMSRGLRGRHGEASGRQRLGKKGRLRKRRALAAAANRQADEKLAREADERQAREKKAKRNREKKFKKRERDKAKKQQQEDVSIEATGQ